MANEPKVTYFNIVTYISPMQVEEVRQKHWEDLEWFCWIQHLHDPLDLYHPENGLLKQPHCHVVMHTFKQYTRRNILKWFYDPVNEQNTFVDHCTHPVGACRYLMHLDDPKKYQYERRDVYCYGIDYDNFIMTEDEEIDPFRCMYRDAKSGMSMDDLVDRYGKAVIVYIRNIERCVERARLENAEQAVQKEKMMEDFDYEYRNCCLDKDT